MKTASITVVIASMLLWTTSLSASDKVGVRALLEAPGKVLNDDQTSAPATSQIDFDFSKEGSRASMKWTLAEKQDSFVSMALSVPFSTNGDTNVFDSNGLPSGNRLTLNFKKTLFSKPKHDLGALNKNCETAKTQLGISVDGCPIDELLDKYGGPAFQQLAKDVWGDGVWLWGLTGSIGDDEFTYFDEATLEQQKSSESPWSMAVSLAHVRQANSVYSLDFIRESKYQSQQSATLCNLESESPVRCVTGSVGAPKNNEVNKVSLQYRGQLGRKSYPFALNVTYDNDSDETTVNLPVYVFSGQDGKSVGGFKLSWSEAENELNFGIFYGAPPPFF